MRHPSAAFHDLRNRTFNTTWAGWQRPTLFLLIIGCVLSIQTSGKLTARLIVDGAISFAFVPICAIVSLALVYPRGRSDVPFARAADLFFAGNGPWLLWLLAFSILRLVLTPIRISALPLWGLRTVECSLIPAAAWSAYIDLQFFRCVPELAGKAAARRLIFQRAISWGCAVLYFFGTAIWPYVGGLIAS